MWFWFMVLKALFNPMNIKGAAYASVFAQFIMAVFSAYYLLKKTDIPLLVKFPFQYRNKTLCINDS